MTNSKDLLNKMINAPGLSGHEAPIQSIVEEAWKPLADELNTSKLGSLHALQRGTGKEPRPSILIATHMDAIGLMVSNVTDGFLRVSEIGGIDHRVLPGQSVTVHCVEGDLPGVIVQPPEHTLAKENRGGPVPLDGLWVDVGLSPRQVARQIDIGDLVSFASDAVEMGDTLTGHSLDNRASVAALTEALTMLQKRPHHWDVWAVATTQEEETLGGALTSAFELRPTLAIAIDVTFAKGPGSTGHDTFPMNKGPVLGWGPNIHPKLFGELKSAADRLEMAYKKEPLPGMSGTDAITLQVAASGAPTAVISIPLRYMHTPVEMVHTKDITRVARLLTEFIAELDEDFLDKIKWQEEEN
ncbi:MAG: M42 family peptidase [Chloroflexi bacterium]|nr:MAG: M42 family peptidase [Chloroflexota bacterium]MBL1193311.1 M42 family peptidase [Chloroflexota bacterium]NOH10603.1 M20/M25/M40 family metallo-hydrolase [Chloroflexota bacterium]